MVNSAQIAATNFGLQGIGYSAPAIAFASTPHGQQNIYEFVDEFVGATPSSPSTAGGILGGAARDVYDTYRN